MSIFGIYKITGLDGKTYYKTAKQFYKRILKDSESDYNWIAHASEIMRICEDPDFPEEYKKEIKIRILRCYANIETRKKEIKSYHTLEDKITVERLYNSMVFSKEEDVISARKSYFYAILNGIVKYDKNCERLKMIYGRDCIKICDEWKKNMFDEYFLKHPLENIDKLRRILKIELYNTLKNAENRWIHEQKEGKKFEGLFKIVNIDEKDER